MKSWYDIYRERMNEVYFGKVKEKYAPFIEKILSYDSLRFFELGCGAGNITKALRELDHYGTRHHTLVDACPRMLGLAVENNPVDNCSFRVGDIRQYSILKPKFEFGNLVHSHGVLEHFENDDILKICKQADKYAGIQVHYVPSAKYDKPSRGDERLMSPEQWKDILGTVKKELGRGVITSIMEFNEGYDLAIIIKREFL